MLLYYLFYFINFSLLLIYLKDYKHIPLKIVFSLLQPICLGGLVSYFAQTNSSDITLNDAYMYATGIALTSAFATIIFHPFYRCITEIGCQIRVACSGLIYRKSLKFLKSATEEGQNGKIINLLSNDLAKLEAGVLWLYRLWLGPLEAAAYFIVIYMEIGMAAFAGMALLAKFIPLQGWFKFQRHFLFKLQKRKASAGGRFQLKK